MNPLTNPPTTPRGTFENPFDSCRKGSIPIIRLNVDIPEPEYNFIKLIRPSKGTVSTTFNLLYSKLITALRSRGIVSFSERADFENFMANCEITIPAQFESKEITQKQTNDYIRNLAQSSAVSTVGDSLANLPGSTSVGSSLNSSGENDRSGTPGTNPTTQNPSLVKSNLPSKGKKPAKPSIVQLPTGGRKPGERGEC